MMSRSNNFSPEEIETLIGCIESNPQLAHGRIGGDLCSKKLLNSAWETLATEVSTVSGISRTGQQVRTKWCDYKFRVRQKASKTSNPSGSLTDNQKLTPLELRVLSLIGPGRVRALTDNGFDTGVVKQDVSREIATSASEVPVSCGVDELGSKNTANKTAYMVLFDQMDRQASVPIKQEGEYILGSELDSSESRLSVEEKDQIDMLPVSQIKKEKVDSEQQEVLSETSYSSIPQGNEDSKGKDPQYTFLIPVQFPFPGQENGENKRIFIENSAFHTIIPVQSRLSEQENEKAKDIQESGTALIKNNTSIPVQSTLSQQENEKSGKNNIQNSPVIHVLSRNPELQNVEKEQNITQSIPAERINGKNSKSAIKIASVISNSFHKGREKKLKGSSKPAPGAPAESQLTQQKNVPSNDTTQNWELAAAPVSKAAGTVRCQRLRSRKRKLREDEENVIEKQVLDTQADMASELKKITSHLATIANTNLEILKYLKNVDQKQDTVISYLSVALNIDDM